MQILECQLARLENCISLVKGRGQLTFKDGFLFGTFLLWHCYRNSATALVGRHRSCGNLTILSSPAFYPFKVLNQIREFLHFFWSNILFAFPQANERSELFKSESDQFWTKKFQRSYSVHFFGQITSGRWLQTIEEKTYLCFSGTGG